MSRDAHIPLFLWVATAALVHILWGGGAEKAADLIEGQTNLLRFAESVKRHVRLSNQPIEITLLSEEDLDPSEEAQLPSRAPAEDAPMGDDPADDSLDDEKKTEETQTEDLKSKSPEEERRAATSEEEPKPESAEKKNEEPPKKEVAPELTKVEPIPSDGRVAVKQHVQDEKQAANPDAQFLGEFDNRVAEQTQARITSNDQNDPLPTPGTHHAGPTDEIGDATVSDVADSTTQEGDPDEAPSAIEQDAPDGERAQLAQEAREARLADPSALGVGQQREASEARSASEGERARAAQEESLAMPEIADSPGGQWYLRRPSEARSAQEAQRGSQRRQAVRGARGQSNSPSLGTLGATPGGFNPNLNTALALAAVGTEQLREERLADGERRRSKHRGSNRTHGLERWRSALENYVAGVTPGNQTALNTARSPFANYLHQIHSRLHPQFAERVLQSLDQLPLDHPMNRYDLMAKLEIVISGQDGRVVRMGVLQSSGVTAFDIEPLESVTRAAPFGAAPPEITSPDGNVYLHWGFNRDPNYACSTYYARLFILRTAPQPAPVTPPEQPSPQPERPRHGKADSAQPEVQDG